MAYTKQTWDTTSIFTPTRMNYIEQGIADGRYAENIAFDNTRSVKDLLQNSVLGTGTITKSSAVTFNATETQILQSTGALHLKPGNYIGICAVNATWTASSHQTMFCVRNVGNTNFNEGYSGANPQTNTPCFIMSSFAVTTESDYYMEIVGKTSNSAKEVTVPAYQSPRIVVLKSM